MTLNAMRHPWRAAGHCAALCCALLAGGCSTLLPESKKEIVSDWNSYDEAQKALSAFEPFKATRADVHAKRLDPRVIPSITMLHFADVIQSFTAVALLKPEDLDPGLRACLHAGQRCSGYALSVAKVDRARVGNFWTDSFAFRRETVTKGWSVDALLVFVDDLLVYQLIGGKPTISEIDVQRNPLGPLQGWGDYIIRGVQ